MKLRTRQFLKTLKILEHRAVVCDSWFIPRARLDAINNLREKLLMNSVVWYELIWKH